MEEFKLKRVELIEELYSISNSALIVKGKVGYGDIPEMHITVQGGIGTFQEDRFLREYYSLD